MKMYRCMDEDCKSLIREDQRLWVLKNSEGKNVYKCPKCRGRLKEEEK